ncbi:iron chelate uptake ABC transporter family permease subunit [Paracoccus caeni]|uniref:Iron chelate uptake ABC transporter family permease subunit n=1 Tax=Paracoccus caeni TaxID=657651 RepID=A0A934SFM1_9RHOB|nr:iron chelate uptake ABC transporter family permease subunit [Paracoccus caeni]
MRVALPVAFLFLCLASISIGAGRMSLSALWSLDREAWLTLTASRIPRLATLILTGIGLAVCGVILQHVVRNRFVEPATTGGLEAAKLGILVALTLMPGQGQGARMVMAMAFCFVASLIWVALITRIRLRNVVLVPVIGLMYGAVLGALADLYGYSRNILQSIQGWMLGDFSKIVQGNYEIVWLILPVVVLTSLFAHRLTLMGMGQEMSRSLGLRWEGMVLLSLMLVSATVSVTVITVGAIPFVGLVVPNLVTLWKGDNLSRTLPLVGFGGAVLLLVCDILGRLVIRPYEVPIGMTVGGIGGLIFLALILKRVG